MSLVALEVSDFRCFTAAAFRPAPAGTTVVIGPNGTGKTSLLEAVGYLASQRSFRGAPREVMVRSGTDRSVLRAELRSGDRPLLVEAELQAEGRSRMQVNRQPVRARTELSDLLPVTVFSPEDLQIVQGGPVQRRLLLDDALGLLDRRAGALVDEVERTLRQRSALLRQAGGRATGDVETTLAVWDDRLATSGTALAEAREALATELAPEVARAYRALATGDVGPGTGTDRAPAPLPPMPVGMRYRRSWSGPLEEALAGARPNDLRRGATTVGPHRDELELSVCDRDARTQGSQGEQRCVALALRLAVHQMVTQRTGRTPLLLLDDVFSELDQARSAALVGLLPIGQALLSTAVPLPPEVEVASVVPVESVISHHPEPPPGDGR